MKKYTDIFPLRLKALQQAYGLSLSETAALLNVNARSMIFDWENKKKFPSVENLNMIATVFGVTTDWLLGRSETIYSNESIEWSEEAIDEHLHSLATLFPNSLQVSYWHFYLCEHYPEYAFEERRSLYYIMGPLSRPRSKILRVAVSRIILSSEASKVKLVGNLVA